jgi:hypothetical protein
MTTTQTKLSQGCSTSLLPLVTPTLGTGMATLASWLDLEVLTGRHAAELAWVAVVLYF